MSGSNVPMHLQVGVYALVDGEPRQVIDYCFVGTDIPNDSELIVTFEGMKPISPHNKNHTVEPIRAGQKPDFIEQGKMVRVAGMDSPQRILSLFYMAKTEVAARNPTEGDLVLLVKGDEPGVAYSVVHFQRGKVRPMLQLVGG